jgi:hypothetical protein
VADDDVGRVLANGAGDAAGEPGVERGVPRGPPRYDALDVDAVALRPMGSAPREREHADDVAARG